MALEPINIVALVTALGLGTILAKLTDAFIIKWKAKKGSKESFTEVFKAIHEVYYALLILLRNSEAHRVVILKTTNGGGKPRLSGNLYSSVVYEAFEAPLGPVKDFWQNQVLDEAYLGVLFNMNKEGRLLIQTDELKDGMLKNLYAKDEIKCSWLFRIAEREADYIYLSINFTENIEQDYALNDILRVGVSKLIHLFRKHDKI